MKRIILIIFVITTLLSQNVYAQTGSYPHNSECITSEEYLFSDKDCQCAKVIITNLRNILCKGNIIQIEFICKFKSEKAKAGDKITFCTKDAIYTTEGTLVLPPDTKVIATVIKIDKPHMPNKNARVYLKFENLILSDGKCYTLNAKPFTKDSSLKEGPWMTTGKLAASTVGLGVVGAGAGTGFAFIPNPAKLGVGFAIGIPVGCTVGLITGLVTPGLNYHAKAGEKIKIILCEDLSLPKYCLK